MCDFRKIIAVVIDGKVIPLEGRKAWFGDFKDPKIQTAEPGLYTVGMSGTGQYYWDGKYWYSDYDSSYTKQCAFIEAEHKDCWQIYADLKKQAYGF